MNDPQSSERTQRVRIGLTGLAFVFLLVMLGTAVSRSGDDPAGAPGTRRGLRQRRPSPKSRWRRSASRRASRASQNEAGARRADAVKAAADRADGGAGAGRCSAAGAGALVLQREVPPTARDAAPLDRKPALALLTSLPLLFGEAFALDAGGSPR